MRAVLAAVPLTVVDGAGVVIRTPRIRRTALRYDVDDAVQVGAADRRQAGLSTRAVVVASAASFVDDPGVPKRRVCAVAAWVTAVHAASVVVVAATIVVAKALAIALCCGPTSGRPRGTGGREGTVAGEGAETDSAQARAAATMCGFTTRPAGADHAAQAVGAVIRCGAG